MPPYLRRAPPLIARAPRLFAASWRVIEPWLDPVTAAKVVWVPTDAAGETRALLDAGIKREELPAPAPSMPKPLFPAETAECDCDQAHMECECSRFGDCFIPTKEPKECRPNGEGGLMRDCWYFDHCPRPLWPYRSDVLASQVAVQFISNFQLIFPIDLKAWKGSDANIAAAQKELMIRSKANSEANLGTYKGGAGGAAATASTFVANYSY